MRIKIWSTNDKCRLFLKARPSAATLLCMHLNPHSLQLWSAAGIFTLLAACTPPPTSSAKLEVASRSTQSGSLSTDGSRAVIGSVVHGGSLWDLATNARLFSWNHSEGQPTLILNTAISPDGYWATTADKHTLILWSIDTGEAANFWRVPSEITSVALGKHGNVALLGLTDNRAAFYDVRSGGIFKNFNHNDRVNTVATSDSLHLSVTGSEDGTVKVWESNSGKLKYEHTYTEPVQLVALSADGKVALVSAKYDRVDIFDTTSEEVLWQLPFKPEHMLRGINVTAAMFSPDNNYLLTGRPDGFVELWDIEQKIQVHRWLLPKRKKWQPSAAAVISVSFTKEPNHYMAISSDGFVHTLTH